MVSVILLAVVVMMGTLNFSPVALAEAGDGVVDGKTVAENDNDPQDPAVIGDDDTEVVTDANPDTPGDTDVSSYKPNDVPKTGDSANLLLWIGMILLGTGVLAGTSVFGKKQKSHK